MSREPLPHESNCPSDWSDQRVERLLGWYFGEEMPPELRRVDSSSSSMPVPKAAGSPRRVPRSVGRWMLPTCVLALLFSVWIMQSPPPVASWIAAAQPSVAVEFESTGLPVLMEQISYSGTHGSFAQRSELRWTSESYFEPGTGEWVEWTAPELTIDVESVAERL